MPTTCGKGRDRTYNIESGVVTLVKHAEQHMDTRNEDVRRGRMVAAAFRRDVEIQYCKPEHTYRLGKLGTVYSM